jgi:hypothetical protein
MHGLPPNSYKLIGSNNQVSTDSGTNVLHLQTLCRIIVFVSLVFLFAARATQAARARSTYRPSWASRRECSTSFGQLAALALPNLQAKALTFSNGRRKSLTWITLLLLPVTAMVTRSKVHCISTRMSGSVEFLTMLQASLPSSAITLISTPVKCS